MCFIKKEHSMYLATVEGVRLPIPTPSELNDWRQRQHALVHLAVAGRDLSLDENTPSPRTTSRIPKIGAAARILLAHNPPLVNFGLWVWVYPSVAQSTELLAVNLLQLERDCMHAKHERPSKWRRDHEHTLVELLSQRFDLVMALLGYRHWPTSAQAQFIAWHILPALVTKH